MLSPPALGARFSVAASGTRRLGTQHFLDDRARRHDAGWNVLGLLSFGYVADAIGRRKTFVLYILLAAALTVLYSVVVNPWLLLVLGPLVAFFGTGFFSGFAAVTAEIYPTSVRAIAQGFTFNIGRFGSAAAPFVVGSLAQTQGFGVAFALLAGALLIGASTWIWLPETRGRSVAT